MTTQGAEKIGGPCRDRTYDQLIKSQHSKMSASCSDYKDKDESGRLETTPFRGVLHPIFEAILAPYSTYCTCPFHDSDGEHIAGRYPCKVHPEADFCEECGGTGIIPGNHFDDLCKGCDGEGK